MHSAWFKILTRDDDGKNNVLRFFFFFTQGTKRTNSCQWVCSSRTVCNTLSRSRRLCLSCLLALSFHHSPGFTLCDPISEQIWAEIRNSGLSLHRQLRPLRWFASCYPGSLPAFCPSGQTRYRWPQKSSLSPPLRQDGHFVLVQVILPAGWLIACVLSHAHKYAYHDHTHTSLHTPASYSCNKHFV